MLIAHGAAQQKDHQAALFLHWRKAHLRLEALVLCGRLLLLQHAQPDADAAVVAAKGEALECLRGVLPAGHKGVVLYAEHKLLTLKLDKARFRQSPRRRPGLQPNHAHTWKGEGQGRTCKW